jgi:uncharacterized RDD family membrane protein YckC
VDPLRWWARRVAASLVDLAVRGAIAVGILIAAAAVLGFGFLGRDETSGLVEVVVALLMAFGALALATLLYEAPYMAVTNGQTLGKQLLRLRVVREDEAPITIGFAATREGVVKGLVIHVVGNAITLGFPVASTVDSLWPIWDPHQRAVHDMIARTRVIGAKETLRPRPRAATGPASR